MASISDLIQLGRCLFEFDLNERDCTNQMMINILSVVSNGYEWECGCTHLVTIVSLISCHFRMIMLLHHHDHRLSVLAQGHVNWQQVSCIMIWVEYVSRQHLQSQSIAAIVAVAIVASSHRLLVCCTFFYSMYRCSDSITFDAYLSLPLIKRRLLYWQYTSKETPLNPTLGDKTKCKYVHSWGYIMRSTRNGCDVQCL